MNPFEFVVVLVVIVTFGKVATHLLGPLSRALAQRIGNSGEDRLKSEVISPQIARSLEVIEAMEGRLERIEERLEFLEELKGPAARPALQKPPPGEGRAAAEG